MSLLELIERRPKGLEDDAPPARMFEEIDHLHDGVRPSRRLLAHHLEDVNLDLEIYTKWAVVEDRAEFKSTSPRGRQQGKKNEEKSR